MIIHSEEEHRFILDKPEGTCYLEYSKQGNEVTVLHTIVPDPLSGKGLAGQLANAFFAWATAKQYVIHSGCSYMTSWLKKQKSNR